MCFVVANAARDSCLSLSSWGEASKEIDELVGFNRWLRLHKIGNCCYFCGWIPAISMNAGSTRVTVKSSCISKFLHFKCELRVCICTLGVSCFRILTCAAEQSVAQYRNRKVVTALCSALASHSCASFYFLVVCVARFWLFFISRNGKKCIEI